MNKIIDLSPMAIEFLLYSYFGIVNEEVMEEEDVALKCAHRAYLDLCRTIEFNEELKGIKGSEEKCSKYIKAEFCNIICLTIVSQIKEVLYNNEKSFDDKHKTICSNIITKANSVMFKWKNEEYEKILVNDLTYGQVQKWLNMTLKYLYLLGVWKDELSSLKDELHIPVDSFVMEAANKDDRFKVNIPYKNKEGKGKYSENNSKPWSGWDFKEYVDFQNSFKNCSRIEWESENWIKIAQERRFNEQNKLVETIKANKVEVKVNE